MLKSDSASKLQAAEILSRPKPNASNSECFFKNIHEHVHVKQCFREIDVLHNKHLCLLTCLKRKLDAIILAQKTMRQREVNCLDYDHTLSQ